MPGHTALTFIPYWAHSSESTPASPISPALAGLYAPRSGTGAVAATDDMNTTRPPSPCATSRFPTALLNRKPPVRCVSRTLLQSWAESSSTGALMLLPAQWTRKSTLPK